MAQKKYLLFGIAFLILALFLVRLYDPKPPLLSITQTSGGQYPFLYEGFMKGVVAVQEITLKKDYLNGFKIRFATMDRKNTNSNTIAVLDSNYNLLFQEKFTSEDIEDTKYRDFRFRESKKVGKGNKVYICFTSNDGDSANSIHGLFNGDSKLGSLYASGLVNDDLISSIPNKIRLYPGALMLRTFESENSISGSIKSLLYLCVFLGAIAFIFFKRIQQFLVRTRIRPEYIYVILAIVFGLLFLFVTPPTQVPDEGSHLTRTVELSEFQFSKTGKTIPSSFISLDSTLGRLHFIPDERTSREEIISMARIRLKPEIRRPSSGPDYIVPYIPQLLGLFIGKLFSSTPLFLFYFGRLFNLLCAILLIYFAIRITPFSKWIIFLLALMPKTLFMMASFSYDAFVISSSFLLIALYLYYAFKHDKTLGWKEIGLLFFLSMLLAFCKPPYFIIGFLFLIIPVRKIGSLLKYILVFSVFLVSFLLAQGMWSLVGGLMKSADTADKAEQVAAGKNLVKDTISASAVSKPGDAGKTNPAGIENKPAEPEINPGRQVNYIKTHFSTFLGLLAATNFDHMRANMLNNFVDTMGWLDTFMPETLVNLYLILLLTAALCIAEEAVYVDWRRKLFFFLLFVSAVLAIETAMYVYASYVAQVNLMGIQGRYFIPLSPLFLLIFYNMVIAEKLNFIFSSRRGSYMKAKPMQKPKILLEIQGEQMFTKYLQVFIIGFTIATLIRGVMAVLMRYYEW